MMYFNTIAKTFSARLALLVAVLIGNAGLAFAASSVTIQGFSIKAGETKEVALELTSDAADLYKVEGTISMPEGLEIVQNAYGQGFHAQATNRANGATAQMNPVDGSFSVIGTASFPFSGTQGAIMTFKVKASQDFTSGTIRYADVTVKHTDKTNTQATSVPTSVTKEQGTVDPDDPDPDPVPGVNALSFSQSTVKLMSGESTTLQIELTNGDAFRAIQATLTASEGVTITSVTKTSRIGGNLMYNADNGNIVTTLGGISGNSGAIINVAIEADEDFSGSATVSLKNIVLTGVDATNPAYPENITAIVTAVAPDAPYLTLSFGDDTEVNLGAGNSIDVPVYASSNVSLKGFMANLTLPEGVTAEVKKGDLTATAPAYNALNGNIVFQGNVSDGEGSLFVLTLTADETFNADAQLTLSGINGTGTDATKPLYAEDITLTVKAKDEAAKAAADAIADALQEKLDNAVAEIAENYPDAAADEDIVSDEAGIQDEIDALKQQIEDAYADNTLDPEKVQEIADAISQEIDDLLEKAKAKQEAIDAKKALDAEIAELQQKLDAAEETIPSEIPADAKKALEDEADAIQAQIDALKAQAEKDYADGKLTADSKLDPEKKQAVLDAIDALKANIAKWLRGDVDNDGDVDMADFYALKKLISEEKTPKADEDANFFYRCDANADGEINVGDLQGILNICTGLSANGK